MDKKQTEKQTQIVQCPVNSLSSSRKRVHFCLRIFIASTSRVSGDRAPTLSAETTIGRRNI